MANLQYIGARYVPKFYENSTDSSSCEWESGKQYEPLTIVSFNNNTYTSKITVPTTVENPANNPNYWALTGQYTASIQALETIVGDHENRIDTIEPIVDSLENNVVAFVTPEMFGAIGDGITDDTAAIQSAINTGKTVLFGNKTYSVNSGISLISNTHIMGNNAIIKIADGVTIDFEDEDVNGIFYGSNIDDIIIKDLTFNCGASGLATYSDYNNKQNVAIALKYCNNIIIDNCIFNNLYTDGIYSLRNGGDQVVNNCQFYYDKLQQGLRSEAIYFITSDADGKITISNNILEAAATEARYGCGGFYFASCYNINICNNEIINCGRDTTYNHALESITLYDDCHNVNICNNNISALYKFLRCFTSDNVVISHNNFHLNADTRANSAMLMVYGDSEWNNITISENVFDGGDYEVPYHHIGVYDVAGNHSHHNITISKNKFINDGSLLRFDNTVSDMIVDGNIVYGNIRSNIILYVVDNASTLTASNIKISNNILNALGGAINISPAASDYVENVDINDNIINSTTAGVAIQGHYIDKFRVYNNTCNGSRLESNNNTSAYAYNNRMYNISTPISGSFNIAYNNYSGDVAI